MDVSTIIIIVLVIVVGIAGALVYVAQRIPKGEGDPLDARLAEFSQRGETVSLDEIELSQPFVERGRRHQCLRFDQQPHPKIRQQWKLYLEVWKLRLGQRAVR